MRFLTNYPESMSPTNDEDTATAVDRYFTANPDIFDVELAEDSTVPRRQREF